MVQTCQDFKTLISREKMETQIGEKTLPCSLRKSNQSISQSNTNKQKHEQKQNPNPNPNQTKPHTTQTKQQRTNARHPLKWLDFMKYLLLRRLLQLSCHPRNHSSSSNYSNHLRQLRQGGRPERWDFTTMRTTHKGGSGCL